MQVSIRSDNEVRVKRLIRAMPKQAGKAMARTLTKVAKSGKSNSAKMIRETFTAKAAGIKKAITTTRAKPQRLVAYIKVKSKRLSLVHFGAKDKDPEGVVVEVRKKGKKIRIPSAFIAKASGSGANRVFVRVGKKRLKIRSLVGPSVTSMFKGTDRRLTAFLKQRLPKVFYQELAHERRKMRR